MRSAFIWALGVAMVLGAGTPPTVDEERLRELERTLLAPCCYQEPVGTHGSPEAAKMSSELGDLISEGKSNREILDYYKRLYGQRILVEPEGGFSVAMYLVLWSAFLLSTAAVVFAIRRMLHRPSVPDTGTPVSVEFPDDEEF